MTQTVPTGIVPTSTPNPVLYSEVLPANITLLHGTHLSSGSTWIVDDKGNNTVDSRKGTFANILLSRRGSGIWTEVLSDDELNDPSYGFAFSPNNHYLAALGWSGVWIIDLQDLSNRIHYNAPVMRIRGFHFTWTPDSKSVLFVIEDEKDFLVQMDLNGKVKPILTISEVFQGKTKLEYLDSLAFVSVTFSPDGTKMAYVPAFPGKTGFLELWMYDLVTEKKELIIDNDRNISQYPIWSPVGSLIVFVKYNQIILFDLKTKSSTIVYYMQEGSNTTSLYWSPDGKRIVFDEYLDANYYIYTYDIDKKELRTVLKGLYYLLSWGTTNNSIFVGYYPVHSNERYLQEVRIE
jgi:Tol biopolymer transport system component